MKRTGIILLLVLFSVRPGHAYSDHRGFNIDSLEAVVAPWTAQAVEAATDSVAHQVVENWKGLMMGYLQVNGLRSEYYARNVLRTARQRHWPQEVIDASKVIGEIFWAQERYDSAAYYYNIALDALENIASGAKSYGNPDGFTQKDIDNNTSSMYGTLGNLYYSMDSLDRAFDCYAKAGEIFDRYGWDESNAVLHYNIGEIWMDEGDFTKERENYETALRYGRQAGDSLWIATPLKGLGALYLAQGRTRKGLRCLEEADRYFSLHEDQEFRYRLETLDFMGQILREQRRHLRTVIWILVLAALLTAAYLVTARKLKLSRSEKEETEEVLEETLKEIPAAKGSPELSAREKEILQLISNGFTGPQIADRICLSPETVKWYRKKLLVKFDASNTADLISKAKDANLI